MLLKVPTFLPGKHQDKKLTICEKNCFFFFFKSIAYSTLVLHPLSKIFPTCHWALQTCLITCVLDLRPEDTWHPSSTKVIPTRHSPSVPQTSLPSVFFSNSIYAMVDHVWHKCPPRAFFCRILRTFFRLWSPATPRWNSLWSFFSQDNEPRCH